MAWLEPTKLSGSFKFAASASSPPMQAPIKARSRDGPGFLFGSAISREDVGKPTERMQ